MTLETVTLSQKFIEYAKKDIQLAKSQGQIMIISKMLKGFVVEYEKKDGFKIVGYQKQNDISHLMTEKEMTIFLARIYEMGYSFFHDLIEI